MPKGKHCYSSFGLMHRVRRKISQGPRAFALSCYIKAAVFAQRLALPLLKFIRPKFFSFNGAKLEYFYHPYNRTWRNERIVEIPIAFDFAEKHKKGRVLEVGNVLSHYRDFKHETVDKYEKSEGVANVDIVDFKPEKKFDLIVSVSTIEHVGFDEDDVNPKKTLTAVNYLKTILAKNGEMVVTAPIGYNKSMDKYTFSNAFGFDRIFFMKRVSGKNEWKQVPVEVAKKCEFGKPYFDGNCIMVGVLKK